MAGLSPSDSTSALMGESAAALQLVDVLQQIRKQQEALHALALEQRSDAAWLRDRITNLERQLEQQFSRSTAGAGESGRYNKSAHP